MKKYLLAALLICAGLSGAPRPFQLYYDFPGPRTVVAGSRSLFWMRPTYAFDATVNSTSDVFTADATYTPVNGDLVRAQSSGTLPAGMCGMVNLYWCIYVVTNASAQTFKLCEAPQQFVPPGTCTGASLNVTTAGTGTLTLSLNQMDGTKVVYQNPPTGFPVGTTFDYTTPATNAECSTTAPTGSGRPYSPTENAICVGATIPSGATPGSTTVTFNLCGDISCTNSGSFTWGIDVIATQTVTYTPPSSFTTPSAQTCWEQVMIARPFPGAEFQGTYPTCTTYSGLANFIPNPLASPIPINGLGAAISGGVSFYGWNLPLDNMAIYTGNSIYRTGGFQTAMGHLGNASSSTLNGAINSSVTTFSVASGSSFLAGGAQVLTISSEAIYCTTLVSNTFSSCTRGYNSTIAASHSNGDVVSYQGLQSVRYYVNAIGGVGVGVSHFTESLFRAARVLGDTTYYDAGVLMQNNIVVHYGADPQFFKFRDTVYGLTDAVALYKYANISPSHWSDIRDSNYSSIFRATETDASGQRFPQQGYQLAGLASHGIIADWQISGDTRVMYAVKRINDYIWANYDMTTHAFMNLEGPTLSPWCSETVVPAANNPNDGNCGTHPLNYQNLQMMIVQSFWWYYAMTGDTTYRDEGDELAAHAFDGAGVTCCSGKQQSEAYFNSFNAFGWRLGTLSPYNWYGDAIASTGGVRTPVTSRFNVGLRH